MEKGGKGKQGSEWTSSKAMIVVRASGKARRESGYKEGKEIWKEEGVERE